MSKSTSTNPFLWRPSRPGGARSRRAWWKRYSGWIVAFVVLTWNVFTFIVPAGDVRAFAVDILTPNPPYSHQVVDSMVDVAQHNVPWQFEPTIYPQSVDYLKEHFNRFDPYHTHKASVDDAEAIADVAGLAQDSALAGAQTIQLSGDLYDTPRVIEPTGTTVASYIAYIVNHGVRGAMVLCRVPMDRRTMNLTRGDRVTVTGVLLGEGSVQNPINGRPLFALYMACASMVKSFNITIDRRGLILIDG